MRNDYGNRPRKKLAGGKRVGKQFGGGLPICLLYTSDAADE